jgi:nucleoside-diphosphate-sugar epimerase
MKVLLLGSGFVGTRAAQLLHESGHAVTAITHSAESAARLQAEKPWRTLQADISCQDSVAALRSQVGPVDAFIHCASSGEGGAENYRAVYVNGMQHLLAYFPEAKPIYTSSTSVYPQTQGEIVTEDTPAEPRKDTGQLTRTAAFYASQAFMGLDARLC